MKNLFAIASLSFVIADSNLKENMIEVDYGAQRCVAQDCTCRVNMSTVPRLPRASLDSTEIFFNEDESHVDDSDADRILRFLDGNRSSTRFTIVGYTDGCGQSLYNYSLANRRAQSTSRFLRSQRSRSFVTTRAVSELSPGHDSSARKAEIVNTLDFYDSLNLRADYYLVDASGSMSSVYDNWIKAIRKQMKSTSKIYVSRRSYCRNGQSALDISPGGATEIWYSLWHVLNLMPSNSTLIVVSDFQSSVPLSQRESQIISGIMERKGIHAIGITP